MNLHGIFLASTTPFDHQGDLYLSKIRENLSRWDTIPAAGYCVASAAGEGPLLASDERSAVWQEAARACAPGKLLLAEISAESVRETVCFATRAAEIGYKAAVVGAPRSCRLQAPCSGVEALYFRAVADQAPLPIVIRDAEPETGLRAGSETIARLAEHPNISAVIESSGDVAYLMELLRCVPAGFPVLTASALTLYPALLLGAAGAVLDFACAAPFFCHSIEEAVRTREYPSAHQLQDRAAPAILAIQKHGIAGLKCALDLQGYYGGMPRLPFLPVSAAAKSEIESALQGLKS
jgi:4-hydroxy-2-oxoglutarate aldolase